MINGRPCKFRCDLALLSARLQATARVPYHHSVRIGAAHFADHSAILADLPVSLCGNLKPEHYANPPGASERYS